MKQYKRFQVWINKTHRGKYDLVDSRTGLVLTEGGYKTPLKRIAAAMNRDERKRTAVQKG